MPKIFNLDLVMLQTADLTGFTGTLTDYYESGICEQTLSCAYLDNPAVGQLEIGDDGFLCGSFLVQLPKIGKLHNFAIYRIFIMQALGGFEPFSEDDYSKNPSESLYREKDEGHFFFLKKKVSLSKENYEIREDYFLSFMEKHKSGKAAIFHLRGELKE